jgi:hypothetical protein
MKSFNAVNRFIAWKADDGDVVFSYLGDGRFQPGQVLLNALDEDGRVFIPMCERRTITSGDCGEVEDGKLVDYNRGNPKYESAANIIVEFDSECGYGKVLYTDMTEQDFNNTIDNSRKFGIIVKDKWEPTKHTYLLMKKGSFGLNFTDCDGNEISVDKAIHFYLTEINSEYSEYNSRPCHIWFENGELKCLVKTESGDIM